MVGRQNARLEEYETALATATVRGAAKGLRADFVHEMSQLQHELAQLRDHMRKQVRRARVRVRAKVRVRVRDEPAAARARAAA